MKKILIISALSVLTLSVKAQTDFNPFESIGKKGKMLTLSNGKYIEVEMYDSLQRIGSVVVNMNTGKVYKLLPIDTVYSESTLDPTIVSRWYSVDPLQQKYAGHSPYNFVLNNPIIFVDPDGRVVVPVGKEATRVWTNFYNAASPEVKAQLDVLKSSDIVYQINYELVESATGGGATYMDKINEKGANTVNIVMAIPKNADEKTKASWEANIIGDEAVQAYQFEQGKIGFIQKKGEMPEASGYDYLDETESKEGSVKAAMAQGVELQSSSKDYKEKVMDGGMDKKEWIQTFENAKGEKYTDFIQGDGLNQSLGGNQINANTTVEQAKSSGTVQKFIYRQDGKSVTSGKK